jgi:hypothetical protein
VQKYSRVANILYVCARSSNTCCAPGSLAAWGLAVRNRHFDLSQHIHDLFRLIPLRRNDRASALGESSLIQPGTENPGHVKLVRNPVVS